MNDLELHPLFAEKPVGRQLEFWKSKADSRWCICGNRAGKTRALLREVAWWATGMHPYRDVPLVTSGWVVTLDREFVLSTLLPVLMEFLPTEMVSRVNKGDCISVDMKSGSIVKFRTYQQGWQKFQGAKIHYAAFDEECPEDVYNEVMVRLIDYKGPHWVAMTPLSGKTWVYHRIVKNRDQHDPDDIQIFQWKTTDNSAIDAKRVEKTYSSMTPEMRIARLHGDFVDFEGLIWPGFDEQVHIVDEFQLPAHWKLWGGIDCGLRHPFAAVLGATDERGGLVIWKVYEKSGGLVSEHCRALLEIFREYAPHAVDVHWKERFSAAMRGERAQFGEDRPTLRCRFAIDPSSQQIREEMRPYGIFSSNATRDILAGLARVGELLDNVKRGVPGVRFMRGRCNALIDELRMYSWAKSRTTHQGVQQKPKDIDDDCCDALRYLSMLHPVPSETPKVEAPEHSFDWYIKQRRAAESIVTRMGNDVPAYQVEARLIRLGRAW